MCAVMATRDEGTGLAIGDVLKRTRTRRKVDIHTSSSRRRSGPSTCARSRTRNGTCFPGPPTPRASCGPMRSSSASTGTPWSTSTAEPWRRRSTPTTPMGSPNRCWSAAGDPAGSRGAAGRAGCGPIGALAAAAVVLLVVLGNWRVDQGQAAASPQGQAPGAPSRERGQRESRRRLQATGHPGAADAG